MIHCDETIDDCIDLGGTLRSSSPIDTLSRIKPLLKAFGITRVANVTGLDTIGIPVATCIRPNAKHLSVSQGKGVTWALAEISAIMESIEGYHAENPRQPDLLGSYAQLKNDYPVISPLVFHGGILSSEALETQALGWVRALELNTQHTAYIPHILTCLDSSQCQSDHFRFAVTSNGLAAGNCLDEAICHGLYEVIERDALYHWWQMTASEQQDCQVRLSSIDAGVNQSLLHKIEAANLSVRLWDITPTSNIPTYRCEIGDNDLARNLGAFVGSGTHLSKDIALSRAVTEAAQVRLTLITGSRDDVFPAFYQDRRQTNGLSPCLDGVVDFNQREQLSIGTSLRENKAQILQRLQQQGHERVLLVDHTKALWNVPVVHVFVPGLRHGS